MVRIPRPVFAAACAALSVSVLSAPARAQGRIVRRDLGISFVVPDEYDIQTEDTGRFKLKMRGPLSNATTLIDTANYTLNQYLIAGIGLMIEVPDPRKGETLDLPTDHEIERLLDTLRELTRGKLSLNFQGSANITIDSVAARALSIVFEDPRGLGSVRTRWIMVAKDEKQYLFLFGCLDSEFQGKVLAFENFMRSVRWTNRQGLPPLPQPKTPVRPRKK